jgi:Ca2+-binding EF-hand superfamily protein
MAPHVAAAHAYADKLEAKAKVAAGVARRAAGTAKVQAAKRARAIAEAAKRQRRKAEALARREYAKAVEIMDEDGDGEISALEVKHYVGHKKDEAMRKISEEWGPRAKAAFAKAEELEGRAKKIMAEAMRKGGRAAMMMEQKATKMLAAAKRAKRKANAIAKEEFAELEAFAKREAKERRRVPRVRYRTAMRLFDERMESLSNKSISKLWRRYDTKHTGHLTHAQFRLMLSGFNITMDDGEFEKFRREYKCLRGQAVPFVAFLFEFGDNAKKKRGAGPQGLLFGKDDPHRPDSSKYRTMVAQDKLVTAQQANNFFKMRIQNDWAGVERAFRKRDIDGSGALDTGEFRKMLQTWNIFLTDSEFRKFRNMHACMNHSVITLKDFKQGFGKQMYSTGSDDIRRQQRNQRRKKRHPEPPSRGGSRVSTSYSRNGGRRNGRSKVSVPRLPGIGEGAMVNGAMPKRRQLPSRSMSRPSYDEDDADDRESVWTDAAESYLTFTDRSGRYATTPRHHRLDKKIAQLTARANWNQRTGRTTSSKMTRDILEAATARARENRRARTSYRSKY